MRPDDPTAIPTPDQPHPEPPLEAPGGGPAADPGAPSMDFVEERDLAPRACTFSLALPEEEDERRIAGRFPVDRVQCDQGVICDLSRTGLRLRRRGRLPGSRPVSVMMSDGELLVTVSAEVRWERKLGFMKWEYGLEFLELPESDARSVSQIAANCREQRKLIRRRA